MTRALILDCDGVLADTERQAHLPAFNQTFAELGLEFRWSEAAYGEVLRIGGGKERMASLITPEFVAAHGLPSDEDGQRELLLEWHRRKTAHYTELIAAGQLPARPGIARLAAEATRSGWLTAVASTSALESVRAVLAMAVGARHAERFSVVAGDDVTAKKPAPDVYLRALQTLGVQPDEAVAIEDSAQGLQAARAAGICTVITVSSYTRSDDFDGAALVVSDLGERGRPMRVLRNPHQLRLGDAIELADLARLLSPDTQPDHHSNK